MAWLLSMLLSMLRFDQGASLTSRAVRGLALSGALAAAVGCGGGPTAVAVPDLDSSSSAGKAMELYDADGDGQIAGAEWEKTPGLNAAKANFDSNGDGGVTRDEMVERIGVLQQMNIGLMNISCEVLLDNRPLEGATVTFDPDEFLANVLQPAVGVTSAAGATFPKIPKENRPSPDSPPGVQAGIYKVRISKIVDGKETIPARYNSDTTLGQQVSKDDAAITNKQVIFRLKSK